MSIAGGARRFGGLPAVLLLVLALLGCGGGGGGGGGGATDGPLGFRVTTVDPVDGALFVALTSSIQATFSAPIFLGRIDDQNFIVSEFTSGTRVTGTVDLSGDHQSAIFTPDDQYLLNTLYEVRIFSDVMSIGGETMAADFVSRFRTVVNSNPPTPPPPPPPANGTIREVGEMLIGRSSHTATLLSSGRVLVASGFNTASTLTDTAEVYQPSTEEFVPTTGRLATARGFHTATRLTNGKVLILGGQAGSKFTETDSAELFDPSAGTFSSAGTMTRARAFHTATLLTDGRVLILGGSVPSTGGSFSSRTAEIYDPSAGSFTALTDMSVYRASHTATLMDSGKVLVAGGNGTDTRCEIYDPTQDSFTVLTREIDKPRRGHTGTLLPDGKVLLVGGEGLAARTAELFDPSVSIFRPSLSNPFKDRKDHTATRTQAGTVLITGGSWIDAGSLFFHRTTEQFRPATQTFIASSPVLKNPTTRHRATLLPDGKILITGGSSLDSRLPELTTAEIWETQ